MVYTTTMAFNGNSRCSLLLFTVVLNSVDWKRAKHFGKQRFYIEESKLGSINTQVVGETSYWTFKVNKFYTELRAVYDIGKHEFIYIKNLRWWCLI